MRDLILTYGLLAVPLGGAAWLLVHCARQRTHRARSARRRERRIRNIAHQRAWDWLMGRKRLRITYLPDGDADR